MTTPPLTYPRTFTVVCPGRRDRVITARTVADLDRVKARVWQVARQLALETAEKVRIRGGIWR